MTTDTSFVENPPSSRRPTKFTDYSGLNKRGGVESQPKRGRGRGSGIARGKPRGKA